MPKEFKVGQTVRLTGEITSVDPDHALIGIGFGPDAKYNKIHLLKTTFEYANAEILKEPIKFSKEQVKAIEEKLPRYFKSYNEGEVGQFGYAKELYDFLDARTED